ncbi:hypothetical protein M885DRAFT_514132 [Pelagophyceae sp. CCMP2097]|nr:hypothetical protein M885DRAFT_514132 [Pelagophyceae sp. CCMP2097]
MQYFGCGSEFALRRPGAVVEAVACDSLQAVFAAVSKGGCAYGMLPVENSIAGGIHKSFDLLLENDVQIHGETLLRKRHALLQLPPKPGAKRVNLETVRSHPNALANCAKYLNANGLRSEARPSAAGCAREIAEQGLAGVGALCSELAAQRYNLEVVVPAVDDVAYDFTRYLVLGKGSLFPAPVLRPKTSLAFAVIDRPGALSAALTEFAKRGINIIKLESRPRRRTVAAGFNYVFFIGFEGHPSDANVAEAVVRLLARSAFVKLLGSYDASPPLQLGEGQALDASLMQI